MLRILRMFAIYTQSACERHFFPDLCALFCCLLTMVILVFVFLALMMTMMMWLLPLHGIMWWETLTDNSYFHLFLNASNVCIITNVLFTRTYTTTLCVAPSLYRYTPRIMYQNWFIHQFIITIIKENLLCYFYIP